VSKVHSPIRRARGACVLVLVALLASVATPPPAAAQARAAEEPRPADGRPVAGRPADTKAAAPAARKPVNSVDTIVSDMRKMNDMPLAGAPPGPGWATGPGHVTMGNRPRGSATPSYWQPHNRAFKSDDWWRVLLPWMVIFDGVGNDASNTRVEFRDLKAWYKSRKTGRWIPISQGPVEGANYPKHLAGTRTVPPNQRTEPGGTVSVRPPGGDVAFHGWCCGARSIDPPDVAAVHVTLQARLIVDDPARPDDRDRAKYLVKVGADYYPTATTKIAEFAPTGYNPAVGMSRFKLITRDWQSISMTTIDVGVEDPRGGSITEAELRAAPPPLD
jgi:hypothetical protein